MVIVAAAGLVWLVSLWIGKPTQAPEAPQAP
jgi:hypothetical protein